MNTFLILFFTLFTYSIASPYHGQIRDLVPADDEDADLSVMELLQKYGYPAEEHFVTTSDGYILRMHRIPHGKNSDTVSDKVVFLMHGLLCSSADWVLTGTEHGLGYLMADAGYDVWMGNARGNHESRNHTTLNPDTDDDFWHFSWHEIGAIDVATMIDYALEVTGQSQVVHIGHSQGSTSYYVMTAMRPEYNAKIKAHFSLAPIAYMNHMTSPLMHILAFWSGSLDLLAELIGMNEFLPSNDFMEMIGDDLCADDDPTQALCSNALFVICGFSPDEMNATILPVLMGHTPAGISVRQMMHYAQEINSGEFRQYDFGLDNLIEYGQLTPPNYELENIQAPIYLYFSRNDWLSAEEDVLKFCTGIGSACKEMILVADGEFNHLDYLYGIRTPELVYKPMIEIIAHLD
ncbi:hypothetical protein Zmor_010147 [Zophobas morio]|uniref:Lipase n=1 Tax=Zophobas morio TaxID=2755281 RepID=A0AA38IS32_9CUCU|nr:hypothetical protein Zmor_010147 [Zophobas morio]